MKLSKSLLKQIRHLEVNISWHMVFINESNIDTIIVYAKLYIVSQVQVNKHPRSTPFIYNMKRQKSKKKSTKDSHCHISWFLFLD